MINNIYAKHARVLQGGSVNEATILGIMLRLLGFGLELSDQINNHENSHYRS